MIKSSLKFFLFLTLSSQAFGIDSMLGIVIQPYIRCEEEKYVWSKMKNEGINPDMELTINNILFLQGQRVFMEGCIVEVSFVLENVKAHAYRNTDKAEALEKTFEYNRALYRKLKDNQEEDWEDYLKWQNDPNRYTREDKFYEIQNAAVLRWHEYEKYLIDGKKYLERGVSAIRKNEVYEEKRMKNLIGHYEELIEYAQNRLNRINNILERFEEE